MVQGTTSDAGKSTLTVALCRILKRRGVRVAPFKPQNMALNSAVGVDGGEIGRAQALQAQAAGVPPCSDMNPVLLKPCSDTGAQVIVNGRAVGNMQASEYHAFKSTARTAVLAAFGRLRGRYEAVIVEGAGSPAEINLREGDIANMGFAEAVDCPVVLVSDIDRGGTFAHIIGTLELLTASEQARVSGFVINRFRGQFSLLEPGVRWLERRTRRPVLGVLPYLQGLRLDAEDAIVQEISTGVDGRLRVRVPVLPRISNHTDFDPLRVHPQVDLQFVAPDQPPPPADVIILPGSKSVRADLHWLRTQGWEEYLRRHLRYGGRLLGICGGFQMLGTSISDPLGLEGPAGSSRGLGWLDMDTVLHPVKQLRTVTGALRIGSVTIGPARVSGYEIHAGVSNGPALRCPLTTFDDGRDDGAVSEDGQVIGTYLHGLFDEPSGVAALLRWMGLRDPAPLDYASMRESSIDRLADAVESHLDVPALLELMGCS